MELVVEGYNKEILFEIVNEFLRHEKLHNFTCFKINEYSIDYIIDQDAADMNDSNFGFSPNEKKLTIIDKFNSLNKQSPYQVGVIFADSLKYYIDKSDFKSLSIYLRSKKINSVINKSKINGR